MVNSPTRNDLDFSSNVWDFRSTASTNRIITILSSVYISHSFFSNSNYIDRRTLSKSLRKFLFLPFSILKKCEQINTRKNYNYTSKNRNIVKPILTYLVGVRRLQHFQTDNRNIDFSTTIYLFNPLRIHFRRIKFIFFFFRSNITVIIQNVSSPRFLYENINSIVSQDPIGYNSFSKIVNLNFKQNEAVNLAD